MKTLDFGSGTAERREIADGGTILYDPGFLRPAEADRLFNSLRGEVPWSQERTFGRPFPRLNAYYADPGVDYTYSGVTHRGAGWTEGLQEIRRRVEAAAGAGFNSLLLNFYRNGQDSMGFHTDAEPELGPNPVVASISLGAVRKFVLKHKTTKELLSYHLTHGSLLVMGGTCQHFWYHGLPKTDKDGERINLTFRRIALPSRNMDDHQAAGDR